MGGASAFQADEDGFESRRPLQINKEEAFWEWFNNLSIPERERFYYSKEDMANVYFEFKILPTLTKLPY